MEALRRLRKANGLRQHEVAELIGVSPQAITRYELGQREPNIDTLTKFADLFDVTLDELVRPEIRKEAG
ncbi:hypothetical protein AGMMS49992_03020 [Clostridia bacterium]|nr:hypothetical protein AGMMS49992_03020 [Clostridia bacterium]